LIGFKAALKTSNRSLCEMGRIRADLLEILENKKSPQQAAGYWW
jgi:hypothetical protein